MNLSVLLGQRNAYVQPVLLEKGYPLRKLGLRIPIPGFDPGAVPPPAPTPDAAYSSHEKNAVLFLEAKGGGSDDDQTEKFLYVQQHPDYLIRVPNSELNITDTGLAIDFGILCTNLQKISEDHARNPLPFPVLHYNEPDRMLTATNITGASFTNPDITSAFRTPVKIPRLPLVYIPFSSYDYQNNAAYFIQKMMIMILSRSGRLERYERLPPLDEIVIQEYPLFTRLGKGEFHELIVTMERILTRLFPDDTTDSQYNINKYREVRKGKIFLRRRSLKKFLALLSSAALDYQHYRGGTIQATLLQFEDTTNPPHTDIYDQIDNFFDPTRFFTPTWDEDE
ncbi:MAG: hypothetical protein M0Q92_03600 [Methanoregula sp.]|jgi:hypothetical protein|nr:hypothetical protein [Methanoregula sp.]